MDNHQLQQIRNILLTRRIHLLKIEQQDLEHREPLSQQAEIIDIAQAFEQLDREKSIAEQERRELMAVDRALAKMATGTFGICESCEEEIPLKRLLVLPEARLCARCQELEEHQQGRMRNTIRSAVA